MSKNRPKHSNQPGGQTKAATTQETTMTTENQNPESQEAADNTAQETAAQSAPAVVDGGVQDNTADTEAQAPDQTQATATEAQETPVQAAPVVQAAVEKANAPVGGFQALFDKIKVEGTATEQALIKGLDAYVAVMAPGKAVDAKTGALQQHTLWQNLRFIIQSSPDGEFDRLWNMVLAYAHMHKDGAFHERYIMRFSEEWHYDLEDLTAFQRLINLVKLTADSTKRAQAIKNVDINRTLEKGFNDRGRTRLISFYN